MQVVFSHGRPLRSNGQIADGLTVDRWATVCQAKPLTVEQRSQVQAWQPLGKLNGERRRWPYKFDILYKVKDNSSRRNFDKVKVYSI